MVLGFSFSISHFRVVTKPPVCHFGFQREPWSQDRTPRNANAAKRDTNTLQWVKQFLPQPLLKLTWRNWNTQQTVHRTRMNESINLQSSSKNRHNKYCDYWRWYCTTEKGHSGTPPLKTFFLGEYHTVFTIQASDKTARKADSWGLNGSVEQLRASKYPTVSNELNSHIATQRTRFECQNARLFCFKNTYHQGVSERKKQVKGSISFFFAWLFRIVNCWELEMPKRLGSFERQTPKFQHTRHQ